MPSPDELSSIFSSMFSGASASSKAQYMTIFIWVIWGILIFAFFAFIYYWIMFKYKVTIFEGSIDRKENGEQVLRILKTRRDRAMRIKDRGVDKLRLLFSFKKINPIDNKYVQPGNHIFFFRTGPYTFNPMPVGVSNPSACFNIDGFDSSFFNLGVQQDAKDYQRDDINKRAQITFIATCVILLLFAGFILWMSFKSANNTIDKVGLIKGTLENIQTGIAPN